MLDNRVEGRREFSRGSFYRALLRTAIDLAPPRIRITPYDLVSLPFYNADFDGPASPQSVADFRNAVRDANALLIVTPEYNHGVPGVLKNAIDWLSRPPRGSVLDSKPAAIMGASPGMVGTARSQSQLRELLSSTNTFAMLRPEVLVNRAKENSMPRVN